MFLKFIPVVLLSISVVGCSNDDPPASGSKNGSGAVAADAAVVSTTCAARCGRETRCATASDPVSPDCTANCSDDFSKPEVYRADALATLGRCLDQLQCGERDDNCSTQAILAMAPDPMGDSRYQSCRSRFDSCDASAPGSFSDDICTWRFMLTDAVQSGIDACLALECSAVNDCLDALLGEI